MNKRPLPCVLAGFVLGEVWMWQFHGTAALAALYLAAIICLIIGAFRKSSLFVLLAIGIIIGGYRGGVWYQNKECMSYWKNKVECSIQGQIDEMNQNEFTCSIVISNLKIEGNPQKGKLLLYLKEKPECRIGSRILIKGRIEDFELPTNPGGFNQRAYREGKGILGLVRNPEVMEIRLGSFLLKDGIYSIRDMSSDSIRKYMREDLSAIGIAMALGDKAYLEDEQKDLYEFAGISHVLAVSGLHMSLLGAAAYKILRKCGFGYPVSVCSAVPCIVIYAVMTGMSSSCLRAAIMLLIYLFAELKGYYYDLPSALSLAAMWLLYEIPARMFDSGFLLSFGAMVSVGMICPFLFRLFQYKTGVHKIRDGFLSGMMITLCTVPLSLYFFYGFSLAGVLLNLIVIPLMSFLVPLLFIGGMGWTVIIPDIAAQLCFKLAEILLDIYTCLCKLAERIPLLYVQSGYRNLRFLISYYIFISILLVILFYIFKKKKHGFCIMMLIVFIFILLFLNLTGRKDCFMTMLDVGQGDGIIYRSNTGVICMIDGGSTSEKNIGQYIIKPALEYYGIRKVDYWFLSHMDEDHISGAKELLESGYPIRNLILPFRENVSEKQLEIEDLARNNHTKICYMKQGDKVKLRDDTFYCLYPKKNGKTEDENQNSLVLLLDTKHQQILLTGDVEKEGEIQMTQYLKKFRPDFSKEQILKVGHHGSANGTMEALLKIFQPDSAIVSCALDNRYGHPAKETIDRIKNADSDLYYTMKHGAIEIRLGKVTSYLGYGVVK